MAKLVKITVNGCRRNMFDKYQDFSDFIDFNIERKHVLRAIRYVEKNGDGTDISPAAIFHFADGTWDTIQKKSGTNTVLVWRHYLRPTSFDEREVYAIALKNKSKEWLYEQY